MATDDLNKGAEFFARLFNVSERRIQQLAKDGIIPKTGRGKYPLIGTVQGYVEFLQARASAVDGGSDDASDSDIRRERLRLTAAQAEAQELKNKVMRDQFAPVDLFSVVTGAIASRIASVLDQIPAKVKRSAPALTATDIDLVKKEITQAQNICADYENVLEKAFDDYASAKEKDS